MGDHDSTSSEFRMPRKRRSIKQPVKDYDEITAPAGHNEQNLDLSHNSSINAISNVNLPLGTNCPEKRNSCWSPETKMIYEVMAGLALSTSDSSTLNTDAICIKIKEMFRNATPPENVRFARRMKTVMAGSDFFESTVVVKTAGECAWKLISSRFPAFKEFLDNFVVENPELAKEHEIKKASHYLVERKRSVEISKDKIPVKNKRQKLLPVVVSVPASATANQATERRIPSPNAVLPRWNLQIPRVIDRSLLFDLKEEVLKTVEGALKEREDAHVASLKQMGEKLEAKLDVLMDTVKQLAGIPVAAKNMLLVDSSTNTENVEEEEKLEKELEEEDVEPKKERKEVEEEDLEQENEEEDVEDEQEEDVEPEEDNEESEDLDVAVIHHKAIREIYTTVACLGSGYFASVYRVKDSQKREFAVKVSKIEGMCDFEDELEAILNMAQQNGEELPRFLSIPQFFIAEIDGCLKRCEKMHVLKMDLFEAIVERKMKFSSILVLQTLVQMSSALNYLHKHNFVHCDVKPDNIMFARLDLINGKPRRIETRLIDFNVMVKLEEPTVFSAQSVSYRSPEMALEMPCDNKIDIWALGVVCLQMASGAGGFRVIEDYDVREMDDFEKNLAILGEIQHLISPVPMKMIRQSSNRALDRTVEFPRRITAERHSMSNAFYYFLETNFIGRELMDILRRMLAVDPTNRPTAAEVIERLAPLNSEEWNDILMS